MSSKAGSDVVMRKWQAATEWKDITRGVVKQATKFGELMAALTEEGDTLTEELLKVHKLLAGPDGDGLSDSDILECSVMVLRNNLKCFVIMQKDMMARILDSFDKDVSTPVDMDLMDSHETKKQYVKALTEYDENKAKIQEVIRKKKMDTDIILQSEKELGRLSEVTDELRSALESSLNHLKEKRSIVYSKCMLQLMDKHHEYILNGWDVLADVRPRLAALEDHLSRAEDRAPNLIREGYLMKKTGFGWTKCWVSVQIQQKKSNSPESAIMLTWQPTSAKPSKDGRRKVDVCLCTVRLRPGSGEFEVVTPSKKRPLVLHAESDSERTAWVDSLLLAISLGLQGINKIQQLPDFDNPLSNTGEGLGGGENNNNTNNSNNKNKLDPSVLYRVEGNTTCADCDCPDPDWASINLGILLCLECSGMHRNLGTHISKVRSLTLDVWDPETVLLAQKLGNKRINAFYEANLQKVQVQKPTQKSEREVRMKYVTHKYKELRFVDDNRKGSASGMLGVMLCECTARNADVMDVLTLLAMGADPNMLGPGPTSLSSSTSSTGSSSSPPTVSSSSESSSPPSSSFSSSSPTLSGGSNTLVTPMISATYHNNLAMLELLLLNGGDVFVSDAFGWSALQHAVQYRMLACASLLLRRGFAGKTAKPVDMRAKALDLAESQNNDQMVRLLKLEDAATQQAADDTRQQVMQSSSPASPVNHQLARLRTYHGRSLSVSLGGEEDKDDTVVVDSNSPPVPSLARRPSQPSILTSSSPSYTSPSTTTPSIAIPIRGRPASRTAAPAPQTSAFSFSSSTNSSPLSLTTSLSNPSSPNRVGSYTSPVRQLSISASYETSMVSSPSTSPRGESELDSSSAPAQVLASPEPSRLQFDSEPEPISNTETKSSGISFRRLTRHSKKPSRDEKEKDKDKDKDKDKEGLSRENSKDKGVGRERSLSRGSSKENLKEARENSRENLREFIKGSFKKKDKDKEKDKERDKDKEKDKEEKDNSESSAPTSPTSHTSPNPHAFVPDFGIYASPATSPTVPHVNTTANTSTNPTSNPTSPVISTPTSPFITPNSSTPSTPTAVDGISPTSPEAFRYSYSPLPSAPMQGYSPLPSGGARGDNTFTFGGDEEYPDPTPIPPDPAVLNQFENPDEKQFFALSTQLVELVNTLKNLVKDEATKKISNCVSAALKEIESFANKERLPTPHMIHDKDHLQQKLNRVLGYVSSLGRVYQLQKHHPVAQSSNNDEAVIRYCSVLSKVCRFLEEGLE